MERGGLVVEFFTSNQEVFGSNHAGHAVVLCYY